MELQLVLLNILSSVALIGVCALFVHALNVLWLEPERLRSKLRRQGIKGPPPSSFLLGNITDLKTQSTLLKSPSDGIESETTAYGCSPATIFPFFEQCRKKYGQIFMFSLGKMQILLVNQPDVLKEITYCTSLDLGKPSYLQEAFGHLLGQGVITSNGAIWAHQKKIIAPELHMDKIKGMMNLMVESSNTLVNSWKLRIEIDGGLGDISIDEDLRIFSGDVISRACFGSSYSKGKEIFLRLRALQEVMSKRGYNFGVPGLRYLPTKSNRDIWRLEKEIHSLILKTVKEREKVIQESDLLQMILQGAKSNDIGPDTIDRFIVDNCKNIYLAGYETTALSATWIMMLLASHPEWQARVRAEILEVCRGQIPDADMLRRMKLLMMVIQEALRLYPAVPTFAREALKDMKFGDFHVPKGVYLWILVITLHHDPEFWGPDANEFNPERFSSGTIGACKLPHLYMPFGIGPRICLGQNFAMVELKILIALILSNFSLSLSPKYRHSPKHGLLLEPEHGVNLLIRRV